MSEASKLERHHSVYEMRPLTSFEYKGFKVAIGEGGPRYEYTKEITKEDCPYGYYDVIFTILQNERALFELPLYIDALQHLENGWTQETFQQARINAAKQAAMVHIDDLIKSGIRNAH